MLTRFTGALHGNSLLKTSWSISGPFLKDQAIYVIRYNDFEYQWLSSIFSGIIPTVALLKVSKRGGEVSWCMLPPLRKEHRLPEEDLNQVL